MGSYENAAEFYDLLYASEKDYQAEAQLLKTFIQEASPAAHSILDVGCGTGAHARSLIDLGFSVDGVDSEEKFVELARAKCPEGSFFVGDLAALDLVGRYDVVTCLFSAIGYVRTEQRLRAAIRSMRDHLNSDGVVLVEPWFEPGQLTDGWISTLAGKSNGLTVYRMSRTVLDNSESRLEFEYLIGRASGIERLSEVHELGLFTQAQMEAAFTDACFVVERKPEILGTRGIYIATGPPTNFRS